MVKIELKREDIFCGSSSVYIIVEEVTADKAIEEMNKVVKVIDHKALDDPSPWLYTHKR